MAARLRIVKVDQSREIFMDATSLTTSLTALQDYLPGLLSGAGHLLLALLIWVIGRKAISFSVGMLERALHARKLDATMVRYACSASRGLLTVALVIMILGQFGVETTTFAALLGGIGLAIGAAWGGLLGHLAAGFFLLALRPFKVGDWITAGGATGTVSEIGLFQTEIETAENVHVIVGNNKLFNDNIQNFTVNPFCRLSMTVETGLHVDPSQVIAWLQAHAATIPGVAQSPAPYAFVNMVTSTVVHVDLVVCCTQADLHQVRNACNLAIRELYLSLSDTASTPASLPVTFSSVPMLNKAKPAQEPARAAPAQHAQPKREPVRAVTHTSQILQPK
jgi:small conductance mechanosensitive channel